MRRNDPPVKQIYSTNIQKTHSFSEAMTVSRLTTHEEINFVRALFISSDKHSIFTEHPSGIFDTFHGKCFIRHYVITLKNSANLATLKIS